MKKVVIAWMLAAGVIAGTGAPDVCRAAEVHGVSFDESRQVEGVTLDLRGLGTLTHKWIFTVSAAGFYTEPGVALEEPLADFSKRLEIDYFYGIRAKDFAEMTRHWIGLNVSDSAYADLARQIEDFNALYRDVDPGDRYALTYVPGMGTELSLNGQALGRIAGRDFAKALFSIWLGEDPVDDTFKASLLGRE